MLQSLFSDQNGIRLKNNRKRTGKSIKLNNTLLIIHGSIKKSQEKFKTM